jgi:glucose-1-phosphate adenylyltransferase
MDLLRNNPPFNLYDKSWPVRTYHPQYPPIKISGTQASRGSIVNSLIGSGTVVIGAQIKNSVVSSNVRIGDQAEILDSIIMESVNVGEKAKIKNAIIDKEVAIPPNAEIGYNLEADHKRFAVTTSGIVIVAKKTSLNNLL